MALQSKTFTVGIVDDLAYNRFALDLILTEESVSEVGNTSQISYALQLRSGSRNFSSYGLGAEIKLAGTVVAKRDQKTEPLMSIQAYSTLLILSGTATIPHNEDGSLNMAVEFWINTPVQNWTPGYMEMTGASMPLTQIARASTITAYNADIEYPALIRINRKNNTYTHSVFYQFGEMSGFLNGDGNLVEEETKLSQDTIDFKIPYSFYTQIPDKPSMDCTLTCRTYSGSTQIGDPQTAVFLITANEKLCAPVVIGEVVDVNPITTDLTEDPNKLIRFMSDAQCTITASAKNEAWLVKRAVTGTKEVVFEDGEDVVVIEGVETGSFVFQAYDSRGYSFEGQTGCPVTNELINYIPLTVNVSAVRTDPTSGNAILTVEGACYTGIFREGVDNVITAQYCVSNGDFVDIEIHAENNRYKGEANVPGLDYRSQHTLKVTVSDLLMEETGEATVNKGIPVFDWGENDFAFHVPVTVNGSPVWTGNVYTGFAQLGGADVGGCSYLAAYILTELRGGLYRLEVSGRLDLSDITETYEYGLSVAALLDLINAHTGNAHTELELQGNGLAHMWKPGGIIATGGEGYSYGVEKRGGYLCFGRYYTPEGNFGQWDMALLASYLEENAAHVNITVLLICSETEE